MIQASKSQKREIIHFSGAKVCYSHGNVRFENFMHIELSEEKFLKGIMGDKKEATLLKQTPKDKTFIHAAGALQ